MLLSPATEQLASIPGRPLEEETLGKLKNFSLDQYLSDCRIFGRENLDPKLRERASQLYEAIRVLRRVSSSFSYEIDKTLEFAEDFLWGEHFIFTNPEPRYVAYTHLKVLDRFLLVGKQRPIPDILERCHAAIAILVRDWLEYEMNASTFPEIRGAEVINFVHEKVQERIRGLNLLRQLTAEFVKAPIPIIHPLGEKTFHSFPCDWVYYAVQSEGVLALAHATGLPQTKYHDEYMFLRTIHISECCFWGVITAVQASMERVHKNDLSSAAEYMREAAKFGSVLVKLFSIFETMPVESFFHGFRPSTGNASAIQSRKYQYMEILVRGFSKEKADALRSKKDVADIANVALDREQTLVGLIEQLGDDPKSDAVNASIERLQSYLLQWRTKHLGIARRYLPPSTKGTGDEGVPYLESNYRTPMPVPIAHVGIAEVSSTRFTMTPAFQIVAEGCTFAWIEIENLSFEEVGRIATERRDKLLEHFNTSRRKLEHHFSIYQTLFSEHRHVSPLGKQLDRVLAEGLEPVNILASTGSFLIALEMLTGLLLGVADRDRLSGVVTFDIAAAGESFRGLQRREIVCGAGEWVLRDEKGIIASYFQGPDSRTALSLAPRPDGGLPVKNVCIVALGAPGISPDTIRQGGELIEELLRPAGNVHPPEIREL